MESIAPPRSLVDQAYETILDALCDGTFQPGVRLTQEDIAAQLKVSRQPVTQALSILKSQGFLAPAGRRGLTVTAVDPAFLKAIYEFRSVVEPLAVRLATPRMTQQDIVRGRSLIGQGRNRVLSGDDRGGLQADMDFHFFLYALSGNPLIGDSMRLNWHHLRRAMGRVLRYPGMSVGVWVEHDRILETMVRGDAEEAADLMRRHLIEAYERVGKDEAHARPAVPAEG